MRQKGMAASKSMDHTRNEVETSKIRGDSSFCNQQGLSSLSGLRRPSETQPKGLGLEAAPFLCPWRAWLF